jgi:Family of unknown function (DUF6232)
VRTYFESAGLQITDEWLQAGGARYPLGAIRRAWSERPSKDGGGGHAIARWTLVLGGACVLIGAVLWPFVGPWVGEHLWVLTIGVPAFLLLLFWQVGLDLLGHHKENRANHLWIDTPVGAVTVLTDNEVEVNKALRALDRARESAVPRSA